MRIALLVLTALGLSAAELPVRQVILYKHGVGYFERSGELRAGEAARLDFKASEMNDVLKSLTIEEAGGGKVTGVRYDSSEPLQKKLGEYSFNLQKSLSLALILDQFKGARIEMKYGTEAIAGAIVSGRLTAESADKQPARELLVILADGGELRTLDLAAATSIKLSDPSLQLQVKEYLAALAISRSKDQRSVYIDSSDKNVRKLFAGYMIPAPVWKSSYRLIFKDTAEPMLEGWAIIDNTTGGDWTNVNLSLVSGRPISFISQLYEPKYITRRTADLQDQIAQGPVIYEGAMEAQAKKMAAPAPPAAMAMRSGAVGGSLGSFADRFNRTDGRRLEAASSIDPGTQARELGDLFEYRFSSPVTVKKNESAMLPFLQQKLNSRKLLIYSDESMQNPLNAAELTNVTNKTLDGGPITIYDSGAYAGEALMDTLKAGDKRLISYAIDLGTRITTAFDSSSVNINEMHSHRGVLTIRNSIQETKTYTAKNVDQKAKTLIIEYPVRPGYKLLNQKPSETTKSRYRFEVKLAAAGTEKFPITEERVYDETYMVSNLTPDTIAVYVRNKVLSEAGRRQLQQIADQKNKISAIQVQIRNLEGQSNEIVADESRLRQNIESLNRVNGQQEQVNKYAGELAARETQLAKLRDQTAAARSQMTKLSDDLNVMIEKLEF
jgi:hypothetical protein